MGAMAAAARSVPLDQGSGILPEREESAEAALEVLLGADLDPIVDMVLLRRNGGYEARAHTGSVSFRRDGRGGYEITGTAGENPLAHRSAAPFTPLSAELAARHPTRRTNSYPHAFDHTAQLFDAAAAPDLCVLHSASHNWEGDGGHRGEHGSMGIVQARAPYVIAGKGVRNDGLVPRSARLVDLAPTAAALLGCRPVAVDDDLGQFTSVQDGQVLQEVLDPGAGRPAHLFGFLFDGTNANVLYAMAASGEAPNVARLMEMGTAYGHGAIASLPTITLANHTTVLTGSHPGHHGILNNAWYDRRTGRQVITNSSATWPVAMESVTPGVDSVHSAVHRTWSDAFTASVNEPCDIDASFSTFEFFRRGEVPPIPTDPSGLPHTTERFVRPSKDYSWSSIVDHMAMDQAVGILSGHYRDIGYPLPRFMFTNFTLTDAAMHEGGPHSEIAAAGVRDSDARLGRILAAVETAGIFDDSAFFLCADHGMEETDPAVRGDWDDALRAAGVVARDEAYSFLYLDESFTG